MNNGDTRLLTCYFFNVKYSLNWGGSACPRVCLNKYLYLGKEQIIVGIIYNIVIITYSHKIIKIIY